MYASLGNRRIIDARITMPRVGVWHADLSIDAEEPPSGKQTITIAESVQLNGTVLRAGSSGGRVTARIIGGAGGLGSQLKSKYYRGVTARIVLDDIARECGESLSPHIDPSLLSRMLSRWVRMAGTASEALLVTCEALGARWRIEGDGSLWIGNETWPVMDAEHDVISSNPSDGTHEVAMMKPSLVPGVLFRGEKVSAVEHVLEAAKIRTRYWVER